MNTFQILTNKLRCAVKNHSDMIDVSVSRRCGTHDVSLSGVAGLSLENIENLSFIKLALPGWHYTGQY